MQKQLALKILIIFAIGIAIYIPVTMVQFKVYERQSYLSEAERAVAASWTGEQTLMTPLLILPYQVKFTKAKDNGESPEVTFHRRFLAVPANTTEIDTSVNNRHVNKGIYQIPVYDSNMSITGGFSRQRLLQSIKEIQKTNGFYQFDTPYLAMHITDVRGINRTPTLEVNGESVALAPGSALSTLPSGLSAKLPAWTNPATDLNFTLNLSLRGMKGLSYVQTADSSEIAMQSNWPHPEFMGASLPAARSISDEGFKAQWQSTQYSNNAASLMPRCLEYDDCRGFLDNATGVNFIDPVDVYLQTERSIKYAMLFIGLSFITFFIFEHLKKVRIHPIQYTLVGLAISVFYLLLISLTEHLAFAWAYAIGATCCSGLLLMYSKHMLKSMKSALWYGLMLVALYGTLFIIVQAEDFALLMGSMLVFFVLGVLMFVTRKLDWYELGTPTNQRSLFDEA